MTLLLRCGAVAFGRPPTGLGRRHHWREKNDLLPRLPGRVWAFVLSPRRSPGSGFRTRAEGRRSDAGLGSFTAAVL